MAALQRVILIETTLEPARRCDDELQTACTLMAASVSLASAAATWADFRLQWGSPSVVTRGVSVAARPPRDRASDAARAPVSQTRVSVFSGSATDA